MRFAIPSLMTQLCRRRALVLLATLSMTALAGSQQAAAQTTSVLRIGYQKAASALVLLKAHGNLEQRLREQGIEVRWAEFTAGPQLLEALNVGAVDFGYVGEVPPLFAQAAGADFVYSAYEIPTPDAEAILVPRDSTLHRVADLKGRKIAFNKGSDVHWLVVALLRQAGLNYADITPVYLAPADARAAFEKGAVDAWAIWDPFQAAAEKQLHARRLASGAGVVSHHQFFLSARAYAEKHGDVIRILLAEIAREGAWIRANTAQAAAQLAPIQGLDADVIEVGLKRYGHVFKPLDAAVLAEQQRLADSFFELQLMPKKIRVADAMLK